MLSSSDVARRVEFIPAWPLDAGDSRTWLNCYVLLLGMSQYKPM